jgi:hypothetical protein
VYETCLWVKRSSRGQSGCANSSSLKSKLPNCDHLCEVSVFCVVLVKSHLFHFLIRTQSY